MTDSMTDVREVIENMLYLETEMERYECAAKADAILSALSSHGLKVLGREPTVEMVAAGRKAEMAHASLLPVWRAMHDAAE